MCIPAESEPLRFIGLDIHKAYFVAIGVNRDKEQIFGPQRVPNGQLAAWIRRELSGRDAVAFAHQQKARIETCLAQFAARDERVPLLAQIPGIGFINAVTLLAAIGDISRFPTANQLVGYAGLGTKVHDSGQTQWRGRITKMGRRDLRRVMVEAAQSAIRYHDHWRAEYRRLCRQTAPKKAKVAVARKLLITVWHVLANGEVDRLATDEQVACSFFALAYKLQVKNLPDGMSALQFTRHHLDRLGNGQELTHIRWGSKTFRLPPSRMDRTAGTA